MLTRMHEYASQYSAHASLCLSVACNSLGKHTSCSNKCESICVQPKLPTLKVKNSFSKCHTQYELLIVTSLKLTPKFQFCTFPSIKLFIVVYPISYILLLQTPKKKTKGQTKFILLYQNTRVNKRKGAYIKTLITHRFLS